MSIVASLTALLKLDTQGFSTGVKSALKSVKRLNRGLAFAATDIRTAGASLTALSAPFAWFGAQSVKLAARAEEQANQIRVIFRDMQQDVGNSIRRFADDFDLAESQATKLIATTGNLLTGFGFTQKGAIKMSDAVNRLAADLTSFDPDIHNVADAAERLTKGMLGQTRGMLALKIAVRQDTAEFTNLVKQLQITEKVTKPAARAIAVFREALKQSKNAIGDYARTSNSFINVMRRIGQRFIDLKIEVGKFLIEGLNLGPMLIRIADGFTKVIKFIKTLNPELKKLISRVLLGVTIMGPFLLILGSIGLAITGIVSGVISLASAIVGLFSPLGLVIAAIVGVGAVLVKVFDVDIKKAGMKVLGFIVNLKTNFTILANFLKALFLNVWNNLPRVVKTIWKNLLTNSSVAVERLAIIMTASFRWIKANWGIMLDGMVITLIKFVVKAALKIKDFAMAFIGIMKSIASGSLDAAKSITNGFLTGIVKGMNAPVVQKTFTETIEAAMKNASGFVALTSGLENLIPMFPGFLTDINSALESIDKTVSGPRGSGGDKENALAALTRGTVAEITKGSVEAFRIRANAQLKPAEETAKNTSEINEKVEQMIDTGIPIRNVATFDIQPA